MASQVHAQLIDPPALQLPSARLDEYAGVYRLNADIKFTIRREGSRLVGERSGRPAQTLSVEAADVLFVAGQPRSRKIFLRGADGRITGFVDRREGRDIPWTRIPSIITRREARLPGSPTRRAARARDSPVPPPS